MRGAGVTGVVADEDVEAGGSEVGGQGDLEEGQGRVFPDLGVGCGKGGPVEVVGEDGGGGVREGGDAAQRGGDEGGADVVWDRPPPIP